MRAEDSALSVAQTVKTRAPTSAEIAVAKARANQGKPGEKMACPYAVSVAMAEADRRQRLQITRYKRAQIRKIAALEVGWGKRLDTLGVTYRALLWVVATNPRERANVVEERYRLLVAYLEKRSPHRSLAALYAACSTFDPHTGEEVPPVAPLEDPA